MTTTGYKRLVIALSALTILLLAIAGKSGWDSGLLHVRIAFADEQAQVFDEMRRTALSADTIGAIQSLESVVRYYPSGTKQIAGSRLDQIVERQRLQAIRDIIAYLRSKTGEDLGDNPERWIQKYAKR